MTLLIAHAIHNHRQEMSDKNANGKKGKLHY